MSSYSFFARFYDSLTSNVDYVNIAKAIDNYVSERKPESNILLDVACGTGSLAVELSKLGYDVIGTDSSCEMLSEAVKKGYDAEKPILFLNQAMDELDLYGTVGVAVCTLDSINHVLDKSVVDKAFSKVSLFLEDDGLFIFDINSVYKHNVILADNTFVYDCEDVYCVWQNSTENGKTTINLDFFELDDDVYYRSSESFCEVAYTEEEIEDLLSKNGFKVIAKYDDYTKQELKEDTQRIVYVVGKV